MTDRRLSSEDCKVCVVYLTKLIGRAKSDFLNEFQKAFDIWDVYSLSELLELCKQKPKQDLVEGLKMVLSLLTERFQSFQAKTTVDLPDVDEFSAYAVLIHDMHVSAKNNEKMWDNICFRSEVIQLFQDVTDFVKQLPDDEARAQILGKACVLKSSLLADETLNDVGLKLQQMVDQLAKFEMPDNLDHFNFSESPEFPFSAEQFGSVAQLESKYLENVDAGDLNNDVAGVYYNLFNYVLVNNKEASKAVELYDFKPEVEEKRFQFVELLNSVVRLNITEITPSCHVVKSALCLLLLTPRRTLVALLKRILDDYKVCPQVVLTLHGCRKVIQVTDSDRKQSLIVSVLDDLLEEMKGDDSFTKNDYKAFSYLLRHLCKVHNVDGHVIPPVVDPTEAIKHFVLDAGNTPSILRRSLNILNFLLEGPANPDQPNPYPIDFDETHEQHVKPGVLLSYLITAHKVTTKGKITWGQNSCLGKLGRKFEHSGILVDMPQFLNHQLNEMLWSYKYQVAKSFSKSVPSLQLEVPEVLVRAMPVDKRKNFRVLNYPDETQLSDTEAVIYSLVELTLASPDYCRNFFSENQITGDNLEAPQDPYSIRYAAASIIATLTNKNVAMEEYSNLSVMIRDLIKHFRWPLPSVPTLLNTTTAQKVVFDVEPVVILGFAAMLDLGSQTDKVVNGKLVKPWNTSTPALINSFCHTANLVLSEHVKNVACKKDDLVNSMAHYVNNTDVIVVAQQLQLVERFARALQALNLPLPQNTNVPTLLTALDRLVTRLLPLSSNEIRKLRPIVFNPKPDSDLIKTETGPWPRVKAVSEWILKSKVVEVKLPDAPQPATQKPRTEDLPVVDDYGIHVNEHKVDKSEVRFLEEPINQAPVEHAPKQQEQSAGERKEPEVVKEDVSTNEIQNTAEPSKVEPQRKCTEDYNPIAEALNDQVNQQNAFEVNEENLEVCNTNDEQAGQKEISENNENKKPNEPMESSVKEKTGFDDANPGSFTNTFGPRHENTSSFNAPFENSDPSNKFGRGTFGSQGRRGMAQDRRAQQSAGQKHPPQNGFNTPFIINSGSDERTDAAQWAGDNANRNRNPNNPRGRRDDNFRNRNNFNQGNRFGGGSGDNAGNHAYNNKVAGARGGRSMGPSRGF